MVVSKTILGIGHNSLPLILPSRPAGLFARAGGGDAMVQDFTEEINEILIAAAEDGCINPSDFQLGRHLQAGGEDISRRLE